MKEDIFLVIRTFIICSTICVGIVSIVYGWYRINTDEAIYWQEIYETDYENLRWKYFALEGSYCRNEDNEYYEKYCK